MGDQEMQLRDVLANQAMSDAERQREQERQKIYDDADKKYQALTGKEVDYQARVQAIVDEQQVALRALATKYAEDEEKRRQEAIDKKIEQNAADKDQELAETELDHADKLLTDQEYQDAAFIIKQNAADRELELLKQKSGAESVEYKKALASKLKDEADYVTKKKKADDDLAKFEKALSSVKKLIGSEELAFVADAFGKKSALYKAFVAVQKATAISEIGVNLVGELSSNAKNSAAFPPPFNGIYLFAANALSVVRAGAAVAKVAGFRTGGATSGKGMGSEVGLQVANNGKLVDSEGFAVAGVVHENEYVIPAWLRQDPQVIQMEQYLEARRVRGFATGGATSADSPTVAAALPASPEVVALLQQLVANQQRQDERMDAWARELKVVNSLYQFHQDYGTYIKVNNESGIR